MVLMSLPVDVHSGHECKFHTVLTLEEYGSGMSNSDCRNCIVGESSR